MLPDWVSPWWQAACLPKCWDVGGVSVPSLSLWHAFALENIGNGYLCGGQCTIDDAAALLLITGMDKRECMDVIHSDRRRMRALGRIAKKLRRSKWNDLHEACADYVATCMRSAQPWQKGGEQSSMAGTPYQLSIVRVLCADYGMTLSDAWNTPYGYARALYDTHAEANGHVSMAHPRYEALAAENIANGVDLYPHLNQEN